MVTSIELLRARAVELVAFAGVFTGAGVEVFWEWVRSTTDLLVAAVVVVLTGVLGVTVGGRVVVAAGRGVVL